MKTKLIILGSGNSMGVPKIDGSWGNCNKRNKKNIRTRCAAVILKGNNSILIDTSPDIKNQLISNKIQKFNLSKNLKNDMYSYQRIIEFNYPIIFDEKSKYTLSLIEEGYSCKSIFKGKFVELQKCQ